MNCTTLHFPTLWVPCAKPVHFVESFLAFFVFVFYVFIDSALAFPVFDNVGKRLYPWMTAPSEAATTPAIPMPRLRKNGAYPEDKVNTIQIISSTNLDRKLRTGITYHVGKPIVV